MHAQTIYKYLDDQGNVIYSEEPPTGKEVKVIEVPPEPPKEETEEGEGAPDKSPEAMDQDKQEPKKDEPQADDSAEIS